MPSPPNFRHTSYEAFSDYLTARLSDVVKQTIKEFEDDSQALALTPMLIPPKASNNAVDGPGGRPEVKVSPQELRRPAGDEMSLEDRPLSHEDLPIRVNSVKTILNELEYEMNPGSELSIGSTVGRNESTLHVRDHQRSHSKADLGGPDASAGDVSTVEAMFVASLYKECDVNKNGMVTVQMLIDVIQNASNHEFKSVTTNELIDAVVAINAKLGTRHIGPSDCMCLESFRIMMLGDYLDLTQVVGVDCAKALLELQEACAQANLIRKVKHLCLAQHANTPLQRSRTTTLKTGIEVAMEPIVATVIILNALTIGISIDITPDWVGWKALEIGYTTFFLGEMSTKIYMFGCGEYFIGADWYWNWFDCLVVACAVVDCVITTATLITGEDSAGILRRLTLLRLVRLARITRMVRLMRLSMFKELALMIKGCIGGVKTLIWAIVFLVVVVYIFGILMRQAIDPTQKPFEDCSTARSSGLVDDYGFVSGDTECNRGALEIDAFYSMLFSSVPRSMLTVFQCFTDGCNTPSGTPLIWHLYDVLGISFVGMYVIGYIFVTFGIFNLILAIFVENTLQYAHASSQRREAQQQREQSEQEAEQLTQLLINICRTEDGSGSVNPDSSQRGLRRFLPQSVSSPEKEDSGTSLGENHLHLRVDRKSFEQALDLEEVQDMFEAFGVDMGSCNNMFEVLDADGNGYLAVSELADGIMRLRGPPNKADAISSVLMLRSLQTSMMHFQKRALENQRSMMELLGSKEVLHYNAMTRRQQQV